MRKDKAPTGHSGNQQYSSVIVRTIIAPLLENLAPLSSNMRIGDDTTKHVAAR